MSETAFFRIIEDSNSALAQKQKELEALQDILIHIAPLFQISNMLMKSFEIIRATLQLDFWKLLEIEYPETSNYEKLHASIRSDESLSISSQPTDDSKSRAILHFENNELRSIVNIMKELPDIVGLREFISDLTLKLKDLEEKYPHIDLGNYEDSV